MKQLVIVIRVPPGKFWKTIVLRIACQACLTVVLECLTVLLRSITILDPPLACLPRLIDVGMERSLLVGWLQEERICLANLVGYQHHLVKVSWKFITL